MNLLNTNMPMTSPKTTFKGKLNILTILTFLSIAACTKETHNVPDALVDEVIYMNLPSSLPLQSPGGWIYHRGGYKGLLIYRRFGNGNADDFVAFDRTCPNHIENTCGIVEVESDNLSVTCPCDGKQYLIFDGIPYNDNSSQPLRQYRVQYFGATLRVFN